MEPESNPAWPPPAGAINVQPYSAASDHRTFMAFFAALDESDPYSPRVVVEGKQHVDGRVERWITVNAPAGERLSATDACRMAGFAAARIFPKLSAGRPIGSTISIHGGAAPR